MGIPYQSLINLYLQNCVRSQKSEIFFQYPGLLPFATLGQNADSEVILSQVAQAINQISDSKTQANLIAASAILAGLKLEDEVIYHLLRRDIMQESTVYRSIQKEAEAKKQREIALNFLRDSLSIEIIAHGTGLSIEEVEQLQQQINKSS